MKNFRKTLIGLLAEDFGFSLNSFVAFSPPDYDDVAFDVKANQNYVLTINLK